MGTSWWPPWAGAQHFPKAGEQVGSSLGLADVAQPGSRCKYALICPFRPPYETSSAGPRLPSPSCAAPGPDGVSPSRKLVISFQPRLCVWALKGGTAALKRFPDLPL